MTIDKQYHGDLEADALRARCSTAMTEVKGSAGYVAIEHVTGTPERRAREASCCSTAAR